MATDDPAKLDAPADLYRCPETGQPLERLESARLQTVNDAIDAGEVLGDDDAPVDQPIDDGLIRADGVYVYPIRNGLPNLLVSDRLAVDAT